MKNKTTLLLVAALALAAAPALAQVDVDAAKALWKDNECQKCHSADRTKKGPSLKKTADKYRGKADGEAKAVEQMSAGKKVKLEDGTEEDHKIINTKDVAAQKNLARWILSH